MDGELPRPPGAEEKTWGWAEELWRQTATREDGSVYCLARAVRVFIRKGGFSSIHCHNRCVNVFSVTDGELMLSRFVLDLGDKGPAIPRETSRFKQLSNSHPAGFIPCSLHQFEALTNVLGLEIYIASGSSGDADASDIVRYSQNGVKA